MGRMTKAAAKTAARDLVAIPRRRVDELADTYYKLDGHGDGDELVLITPSLEREIWRPASGLKSYGIRIEAKEYEFHGVAPDDGRIRLNYRQRSA